MTNTDTADVPGTIRQVAALAQAGSQLVRVTVNNEAAAAAVPAIVDGLAEQGVAVPIIGDFHYNGHLLLTRYPDCARALAKYRINPGNVGGKHADENFRAIIEVALQNEKPVRIGVNWGSLDQALLTELMDENARLAWPRDARDVMMDAMVESALRSAAQAESLGMQHDRILLSAKVSGVQDLVDVYRMLAARCDYPLHLGLTEAGMGMKGIVASASGPGHPASGGDRRHHSRLAHAAARRRPHRGSPGRPADSAVARAPEFHAPGHRLPGLRADHEHLLPADGRGHPGVPPRADAGLARPIPGCGGAEGGRDGLRRERARGVEARQHRHFAARDVRGAQGAGLRRWAACS